MIQERPRPRVQFALFARAYLGLKLYPWQYKILIALERKRVSAVVCNGGGKSNFVIPSAVLGFLYNWPGGRVMVTSGSFGQVEDVIWPAIQRYAHLPYFKGWHWSNVRIDTPEGGFAKGFSTNDPYNLEGQHQDPDRGAPLLYIVDEAKALDDDMYAHINRCSPTFYMQVSSACPAQGYFFDSFTKLKEVFWTIKITSNDCPHVTDEQRAIDRVTLDPKEYAMKHLSEFSDDLSGAAISLTVINRALERQRGMEHRPHIRCAFCDFALNRAEHVLALRDGNKVSIVAAWQESDTTQARRQFIEHFKRLKLHPAEIYGDAGGPGYVMIKELKDAGWPINEVNNAESAQDAVHFSNRGSEIWLRAAEIIEKGENGQFIIIPEDKRFIEQATNRKYELDSKQRRRIQSKDELKVSPDRADAVFGALVCRPSAWNPTKVGQVHIPANPFGSGFVRF